MAPELSLEEQWQLTNCCGGGEIFFALLGDGYLTLAECYAAATPWFSWRMVLIGDLLYRPFARHRAARRP
jgi:hypothetical protein